MKRFTFFFAFAVALYLTGGLAYAQHGHGAGGAVGGLTTHGESGSHGNAGDSGTGPSNGTRSEPASVQLSENQHLNTALTKALGNLVPGGNLQTACQGFTNLGRCISAIHVAHNRDNINFFCLREELTGVAAGTTCPSGTTGKGAKSLGAAIRFFDPNADSKAEATKATKQANTDIDTASQGQT